VRRRWRSIIPGLDRMRSSEAYWHVGAVVTGSDQLVEAVLERELKLMMCAILILLEAITEEYIGECVEPGRLLWRSQRVLRRPRNRLDRSPFLGADLHLKSVNPGPGRWILGRRNS